MKDSEIKKYFIWGIKIILDIFYNIYKMLYESDIFVFMIWDMCVMSFIIVFYLE